MEDDIRIKIADMVSSLTSEERKLYEDYKVKPGHVETVEQTKRISEKYGLEEGQALDVISLKGTVAYFERQVELARELESSRDVNLTILSNCALKNPAAQHKI